MEVTVSSCTTTTLGFGHQLLQRQAFRPVLRIGKWKGNNGKIVWVFGVQAPSIIPTFFSNLHFYRRGHYAGTNTTCAVNSRNSDGAEYDGHSGW